MVASQILVGALITDDNRTQTLTKCLHRPTNSTRTAMALSFTTEAAVC